MCTGDLDVVNNDTGDLLCRLEVLYLGGNQLTEIPAEVGHLHSLVGLNLSGNRLQSLPPTLPSLRRLQSLNLHNNCLQTLPLEIVALNLVELSLRKNPLINRFVQVTNPASATLCRQSILHLLLCVGSRLLCTGLQAFNCFFAENQSCTNHFVLVIKALPTTYNQLFSTGN